MVNLNGFLSRVRSGDVMAVGILADFLEEVGHDKARAVRRLWQKFDRRARYFATKDPWTAREWTRCEAIAWDIMALRRDIAKLFGRKWKLPCCKKTIDYHRRSIKSALGVVKTYGGQVEAE